MSHLTVSTSLTVQITRRYWIDMKTREKAIEKARKLKHTFIFRKGKVWKSVKTGFRIPGDADEFEFVRLK